LYFIFLFNFHFEVKEQEIQIQKINLQNFLFLELFPSNFYSFFVVLVEDCKKKGRILGGICDASAFLGTISILNDVNHTSNDLNDLKQWAGCHYEGETKYIAKQAVRDGNVITANGTAPLEFAKEILFALNVANERKVMEWYNFHKLGFYTAPMPKM